MILILLFLFIFLIIYYVVRDKKGEYHSHWSTLVPTFNYSTKEFYGKLQEVVAKNKIENISTKVVTEREGNMLSTSRTYFKIHWKEYNYYMCVAPFGEGLFLSWWLFYKQRKRELIIGAIPFIGPWLLHKLFPTTMYRIDTSSMFMTYCHDAMKQVLDEITKDTGFRLSESDQKPIIKNLFKR